MQEEEQKILDAYSELKCDLAPELLNKLREDTQPIIENGVAQSPAKTPQSKAPLKEEPPKRRQNNGQGKVRCCNLFASRGRQIQEGSAEGHGHRGNLQCHSRVQYSGLPQGSNQSADSTACRASANSSSYKQQNGSNSLSQCDDARRRQTDLASSWSSLDKSPVTGSSDTSYYSCNSLGSTSAKLASSGMQQSRYHSGSRNFQATTDSRNDENGGKHFHSPNDHSSANSKRRSSGRSRQSLSLSDFLFPADQRQRQESASPELPGQQQRGRNRKGGGKKKKKGGQSQGREQSGCASSPHSPTTFTSDSDDFPSFR